MRLAKTLVLVGIVALALPQIAAAADTKNDIGVVVGYIAPMSITPAPSSEPGELKAMLQAGRLYVLDRGYAGFQLMRDILDDCSSFIVRVKDDIAYTIKEERTLTEEDRQAGVLRAVIVDRLGTSHHKDFFPDRCLRLVIVRRIKPEGTSEELYLLTDQLDLPAELVALGYRYRWTIELFFRWLKCILGCRHLLSTDANGVQLQIYAALIASLLLTGRHDHWPGAGRRGRDAYGIRGGLARHGQG